MRFARFRQRIGHGHRLERNPHASAKHARRAAFRRAIEPLEARLLLTTISPVDLRKAYGIDQIKLGAAGLAGNGAGQTIGIIEIGTDASLVSDLQYFDQQLFGSGAGGAQLLDTFGSYTGPVSGSTKPWFDTISDPNFPPSVGTAKQDLEAALDVEWAHVVAPMANIVVVQTASNQSGAAYVAAQTQLGVSTVASSYYQFPNLNPANYSQPDVAFVGITGDTGTSINSQQVGFTLNNFPASSPSIIAVGGTTLTLNADGSYGSETGWGFASPNRFLTSSQAYIAPGYWNAVAGGFSGTYYTSPGPSGSTSTVWSTTVTSSDVLGLNDSGLELSTTWTPNSSNADNAEYEISVNGTPVDTVTVNQQLAPIGTTGTLNSRTATFQELCALTKLAVGDTITITIPAQNADGSVVVDAIGLAPDDAGGGGLSNNPAPSFQSGLVIHNGSSIISANGTRANPDVAFDGDYINSPVDIYNQGAVQLAAGTSLGAPAWAALLAIADQGLALAGQPAMSTATALAGLYSLPSYNFHDETSGYNGYAAGPGYNLVTGLGSPVANQLIPDLDNTVASQFHVTAPASASVTENASLVFSSANSNAISVTDTGAGSGVEQLTLVATKGGLTLGSTAGLNFVSGSNGSASITVQGTLANLNAALAGLKFTPTTGYSGPASVTTSYEDLGIAQTTSATTAISVVVPASKPTVKIEAPKQGATGKAVPLEILVADTNATAQAASFQFEISFGDGTPIKTGSAKSPLLFSHVYTRAGTYTLAVIAKDEYGHTSAVASVTIKILALLTGTGPLTSTTTTASMGSAPVEDSESAADIFAIPGNPQGDSPDELVQWGAVSAAVDILNG
jgi:PKD domain